MPKPVEEIHHKLQERIRFQQPTTDAQTRIRDIFNGDVAVPVLDKSVEPAIMNIAQQGAEALAQRMASTQPEITFIPYKRGIDKYEKLANTQRDVAYSFWSENRMKLKDYRRYLYLVTYGSAPVIIRPNPITKSPMWELRDPITTYPALTNDPDELTPTDCIFTFRRTLSWIKRYYPEAARNSFFSKYSMQNQSSDDKLFTILEYNDHAETVLAVAGPSTDQSIENHYSVMNDTPQAILLDRIPNRVGRCTVVIPGRTSLDRRQGQFDGTFGLYTKMAQLMELQYEAAKRGVFPEQWLEGRSGELAEVVTDADPENGIVGVTKGGGMNNIAIDPSYASLPMLDRLERYFRQEGGVPVEFGGESGSNIRTGSRGNAVLSATVTYPVQAAQETVAQAKELELQLAIETDRKYFSTDKHGATLSKSTYVNWKGARGRIDYTPAEVWDDTTECHVYYSQAGVDANGQAILAGQLNGAGFQSRRSAMTALPLIEDVEQELDFIQAEKLEDALLQGIQAKTADGTLDPLYVAKMMKNIRSDKTDLAEAYIQANKQAQADQAKLLADQQAQAQAAQAGQGGTNPAIQPGLSVPGGPTAALPDPGIQGPSQDSQDLQALLGNLRLTQMRTPAEMPAGG